MKTKAKATILLTLLAALGWTRPAVAQSTDVAVVINPSNRTNNLTMGQLRKLLAGEKSSWRDGVPVTLLVRAPGTRERAVLLKLLGMSESEYKQYWTSQILRGQVLREPTTLPSVGMQKEAMSVYPGGITLMDARDVRPGMKVIKVDGLLPGEPGYPLH
jgi:hypothetical protein